MDTESQDIKREVSDYSPSRFIPGRLLDSGLGDLFTNAINRGGGWVRGQDLKVRENSV